MHDNAYSDIIFEGGEGGSFLAAPGAMETGVEFFSLSKSFNVTGARISFLIGRRDVVDAVLANGANTIHSLDFSIRDTDALRKRALESAVKDARNKADAIAHALGKSIVGVQHVSENTGMFQPRQSNGMMMKSMDGAAESTPIDAGTLSLSADVHIDFILAH